MNRKQPSFGNRYYLPTQPNCLENSYWTRFNWFNIIIRKFLKMLAKTWVSVTDVTLTKNVSLNEKKTAFELRITDCQLKPSFRLLLIGSYSNESYSESRRVSCVSSSYPDLTIPLMDPKKDLNGYELNDSNEPWTMQHSFA